MVTFLKRLFAAFGILASYLLVVNAAIAGISIIDDAGRSVNIEQPAQRIVLTSASDFLALNLMDEDPQKRVLAWPRSEVAGLFGESFESISSRFPQIKDIRYLPNGGFPVEFIISLKPDLVVITPFSNADDRSIRQMEAVGIPVALLTVTPWNRIEDPTAGLRRLGKLIGQEGKAEAFSTFYTQKLALIRQRTATVSNRPVVLMEAHATPASCCTSPGRQQSIGDFIDLVGGINLGGEIIPSGVGQVSLEYIVRRAPDIYIASGGIHTAMRGGLAIGPGYSLEPARESVKLLTMRTGIAELPAVRSRRVHGIWHYLATSPINIVAMEAIAKWVQPDLFTDFDPQRTLDIINHEFFAIPLPGALFVSLYDNPAGVR